MSEQTEFLKDLDIDQKKDVLDAPLDDPEKKEETPEDAEMKLKNRRERRLAEKWQAEREANIDLNARLQTIKESQVLREEPVAEYLKRVEKIYGNATPEAIEATNLLKEALQGVKDSAKQEALAEVEARAGNESEAVKKEEQTIDDMLDEVEDEYDVDMSDSDTRKGFLTLLEKVSPKDQDGNIIEYADASTVYELYELGKQKSSNRAKELASRSMTRSGASQPSKLEDDAAVRFLKENGII